MLVTTACIPFQSNNTLASVILFNYTLLYCWDSSLFVYCKKKETKSTTMIYLIKLCVFPSNFMNQMILGYPFISCHHQPQLNRHCIVIQSSRLESQNHPAMLTEGLHGRFCASQISAVLKFPTRQQFSLKQCIASFRKAISSIPASHSGVRHGRSPRCWTFAELSCIIHGADDSVSWQCHF